MSSNSCRIVFIMLVLLISPSAFAATLTLQPSQWYLLSVPNDSGQSLGEVFDGKLNVENYNATWVAHTFNAQDQAYEVPGINTSLRPGVGFWFLHTESSPINVELDLTARTVLLESAGYCNSSIGCFKLDLPTGEGVKWSMVGTPFPEGVAINDIQIVTSAGPCQSGCNLQLAKEMGLLGEGFQGFDATSNTYQVMSANDYIDALDGYWFGTNIPAGLAPAYLVFPTYCTPFI